MKKLERRTLGISVDEPKWERVPKVATGNRRERVALSVGEVEMAIGASVDNSIGSSQATAVVIPEIRQIEIPPSVSTPVPAQPVAT